MHIYELYICCRLRFHPISHDAAVASGVLLGRNAASSHSVTPAPQFLSLFYLKSDVASLESQKKTKKKHSFFFSRGR